LRPYFNVPPAEFWIPKVIRGLDDQHFEANRISEAKPHCDEEELLSN